jgi:RNA polymerase sigma-54 factor
LIDYVNEALAENPLLESNESEDMADQKKRTEVEWEDYIDQMREYFPERGIPKEVRKEVLYESMAVHDIELHEHLLNQLGCLDLSPLKYKIGKYLIYNINPSGYLAVSVEQGSKDLQTDPEMIQDTLNAIQAMDPPGIGARNLKECLLIQLNQKNLDIQEKTDLSHMIAHHLSDLGAGRLHRAAQSMGLTIQKAQLLADWIKKLNPKPGASFSNGEMIQYINPDILVQKNGEDYQIIINDRHLPQLVINRTYHKMLSQDSGADTKVRDFIEHKLNQAAWLIKCVEQRKATIYKVAEALLERQRNFFDQGVPGLRPLTLKDIASDIGVHESTVSRATTNKYIQTPHGIYDFKFFFMTGLQTQSGEHASTESIKTKLKAFIKGENTHKPYTDRQLAEHMGKQGIQIARRTVSKYREEMGIFSASQRRRFD